MPTIRPTKRLLLPVNDRDAAIFTAIIDDEAARTSLSTSDAIIRDVLCAHLPSNGFARRYVERVYAGESTVLGGIADVAEWNTAGIGWTVRQSDYLDILDFAHDLVAAKRLRLDMNHEFIPHLASRFDSVVGYVETHDEKDHAIVESVRYGRELLATMTNDQPSCPAAPLLAYLRQNFDLIGDTQAASAAMSDICAILADDPTYSDSPSDRAEWSALLDRVATKWGE